MLILAVVVLLAAIAGFATWYFTRFVIDDEELRIETGAIFKKSTKIPFERLQSVDIIQPLAARIVGLAELRLTPGTPPSCATSAAAKPRDYATICSPGPTDSRPASAILINKQRRASSPTWGSRSAAGSCPPQRLIGSLPSTEWLVPAAITIIILVDRSPAATPYVLGGLIPLLIGMLTLVWRRVIGMFNFTLAESPRGLRVTRGLTNLTSQSVPIDRIQGVKTSQPLL